MLVISDAPDVVPGCGLVAAKTLSYASRSAAAGHPLIFLARNFLRDHVEVHHVMARRRLVALCAVQVAGRGMLKSGNSPGGGRVALSTVLAEKA